MRTPKTLVVLCAAFASAAGAARAQLPTGHLLAAAVGSEAGYTSNRLGDSDGRGSGFVSTWPELRYAGLLAGNWELGARAAYWRREFLASDASFEDELDGGLSSLATHGWLRVSVAADAGRFRNGDDPSDDNRWARLSPSAWCVDQAGRELGLRARVIYKQYDSLQTWSGRDEDAVVWRVTPNLSWPCSEHLLAWVEAYVEGASSNEGEDEYDGVGARVGAIWTPRPKWRVEANLGAGRQTYDNVGDSEENTWLAAARTRYRWNPWVDLFAAGNVESWNDRDGEAGDEWQVRCGMELTFERELSGVAQRR